MPKGLYSHRDPHDGTLLGYERFSCAPGPSGWRYAAQLLGPDLVTATGSVDLTVDRSWRPIRVEVRGGGWSVRGGVTGPDVVWVRADPAGGEAVEGSARAVSFTGRSPAFAVVTARLLRLTPGATVRVRLVALTEPVLAPRTVDEGWGLTEVVPHQTPTVPLPVERYEVADLSTGDRRVVHLAGDLVLAAPGVELEELDGPPWLELREAHGREEPE